MKVDPIGRFESARDLAGDRPPTDDDVSITRGGRRLDTPAKLIAFLDEINSQRTSAENGLEERVGLGIGEIVKHALTVRGMWPGSSEHLIDRDFLTL